MMSKWWQSEKKGIPVAIATPIVDVAESSPVHNNYYVAAPCGGGPQQPVGYDSGPLDAHIYNLQSMGHRTQTHKLFVMFSVIAGLTGVNNIFSQILALTYPGNLQSDVLLRIYMIGFFILVVVNETERVSALRSSIVINNWVCRGLLYTFLGVLGQDLYDVGYDNRYRRNGYNQSSTSGYRSGDYNGYYGPRMPSSEDFAEWYIWLTSFLMFMVGAIYLIMGALCLQSKLQKLREQYQQSQFAVAANREGAAACACFA